MLAAHNAPGTPPGAFFFAIVLPTLATLTLCYAGGALLAVLFVIARSWALAAIALTLLAVLLQSQPRSGVPLQFRLGFACAGLLLAQLALQARRADCRGWLQDGQAVTVTGILLEQPSHRVARLRLERIANRGCSSAVRLLLPRPLLVLRAGDRLAVRAVWQRDPPGQPMDAFAGVLIGQQVRVQPGQDAVARARGRIVLRLRALFGDQAPLAEALLVAQRDGIDPKVKQDFAASGLAHLLAISGTHVALVATLVLLLTSLLRLPPVLGNPVAAAAAVAYVLFLGAPYPAARAAIQIVLLLAARMLQRPAHSFALLAAAALLILLYDPLAVVDAGFQLSFAGLLGILLWRKRLIDRLPASIPLILRDAIATSSAASLATTPIVAFHFGQISTIAVFANLLAVPLVSIAVPAAACALVIDPLSHAAAQFFADGAALLLSRLEDVAALAAAAPGGHFFITRATLLASALAVFVLWYAAPRLHRLRRPIRWSVQAATAAAIVAGAPVPGRRDSHSIEIHALDVGQGDAVAVRSPRGRWLLIDAGPRSERYDAGAARVVPFLLRRGAHDLEVFILTHPHLDHTGGAPAVARVLAPRLLLDPDSFPFADTLTTGHPDVRRWLRARPGLRVRFDQMQIEVLHPDAAALRDAPDPNDVSVIVRLTYGRFGALFTGDAPAHVEERLVEQYGGRLDVDLIKVGHHGSQTSTSSRWLDVTTPVVALVSAGRGNRYGHPAPEVIQRLAAAGVRTLRTDRLGTVSLRAYGDGRIEAMKSP